MNNSMTLSVRFAVCFALIDMLKPIDQQTAASADARTTKSMAMASMLQDVDVAILVDQAVAKAPRGSRALSDIGEIAEDLDNVREECCASLRRNGVTRERIAEGVRTALAREHLAFPIGLRF